MWRHPFQWTWANSAARLAQTVDAGDLWKVGLQLDTNGIYFLTDDSPVTWTSWGGGGGSGTVTSVAMTVPSFLSVTGSPVTTSGTLAISLSGTALPVANGGTGGTSPSAARTALGLAIGSDIQAYSLNLATIAGLTATTDNFIQAKSSAWTTRTPAQVTADLSVMVGDSGTGGTKGLVPAPAAGDAAAAKFLKADGTWAVPSGGGGGGGTVTSVAMTVPSILSVSGSPITTSGTLAVSLANQNANLVFAGPSTGSPAAPAFRSLVLADMPSGLGLTASPLSQFAATTSAQLAGVISDETGSGALVFGTSPALTSPDITTSITTPSATFSIASANATTVNFAGAATTLNMGGSGAAINLGGGATAAELRFLEPSGSGTNYTALKAQAQAGNVTYTLPAADGSSGQVLSTNGSGSLSWAASGGSSSSAAFVQTADGSCANTTTETAITSTGVGSLTISANDPVAGDNYRLTLRGFHSTVSGGGTYQLKVYIGSTAICLTSSTFVNTSGSNFGWEAVCDFTFRTVGASGTVYSFGRNERFTGAAAATVLQMIGSTINSTTTIDTTASMVVSAKITWAAANAANVVTCTNAILQKLKN